MTNPEDAPLGGKPVLPPPSRDARDRAHPLFSRLLNERTAARAPEPQRDEPTRMAEAFPRTSFESGRRYDATIAFIQATAGPIGGWSAPDEAQHARGEFVPGAYATPRADAGERDASEVDSEIDAAELARLDALALEHDALEDTIARELPRRPPPFAPMVRPSPPKRTGAERVDEASLASMVDTSMLIASPDGTASFEIAFDDEVFNNLACSISVTPAGVIATFKVDDPNTRRLLEAEAGRLRVQLAERGLKVADVRVEMV